MRYPQSWEKASETESAESATDICILRDLEWSAQSSDTITKHGGVLCLSSWLHLSVRCQAQHHEAFFPEKCLTCLCVRIPSSELQATRREDRKERRKKYLQQLKEKKRGGRVAVQSVQLMLVLIKFNSPFAFLLCFSCSSVEQQTQHVRVDSRGESS